MVADGKPSMGGGAAAGDGLREETLLQRKLAEYATSIGRFGLGAAALAFAAMTARFRCGRAGWRGLPLPRTHLPGSAHGSTVPRQSAGPRSCQGPVALPPCMRSACTQHCTAPCTKPS